MRAGLRWFPPALFGAGLVILGYGLAYESGWRRVVVGVYLLWTVAELRVTFRGEAGETGGADRGSMPLYGLARGLVVLAALLAAPAHSVVVPGLPLLVAGAVLRLAAIAQLGRFYSHKVRTVAGHQIVQTGPYRLVRHPAYTGMLIAHTGFVLVFLTSFSLTALALLAAAIVNRILVEERTLLRVRGYAAYARGRKRLIPAVW